MEASKLQKTEENIEGLDLNGCKMTCGQYGALWPRPSGYVNLSEALFDVFPDKIALEMKALNDQQEIDDTGIFTDQFILFALFCIVLF